MLVRVPWGGPAASRLQLAVGGGSVGNRQFLLWHFVVAGNTGRVEHLGWNLGSCALGGDTPDVAVSVAGGGEWNRLREFWRGSGRGLEAEGTAKTLVISSQGLNAVGTRGCYQPEPLAQEREISGDWVFSVSLGGVWQQGGGSFLQSWWTLAAGGEEEGKSSAHSMAMLRPQFICQDKPVLPSYSVGPRNRWKLFLQSTGSCSSSGLMLLRGKA
ncbi:UNVERIFIED_CONTAM: hypothetical protein K2H54_008108 [Gekko kuhli]